MPHIAASSARVIRHLFAPVYAPFADQLGLPRRLNPPEPATVPVNPQSLAPGHAVALTFDDGPHPQGTPAMLEVLARHGASATFFVIGEQVVQRPQLLQRMLAEGHAVALHGYHHRLHLRCRPAELEDDFTRGIAAIEDAIGQRPLFHRPPFGIYSPASLRIARERGLQPLLWAAWGKDWRKFTTPRRITARIMRKLTPGDVILLHDADFYSAKGSHERTAVALELLLAELKSDGFGTFLRGS